MKPIDIREYEKIIIDLIEDCFENKQVYTDRPRINLFRGDNSLMPDLTIVTEDGIGFTADLKFLGDNLNDITAIDEEIRRKDSLRSARIRTVMQNKYETSFIVESGLYEPTREALSYLMQLECLKPEDVAEMLDVNLKTVFSWLSKPEAKTAGRMPYSSWELLHLKLGRHPKFDLVKKDT